MNQHMFQWITCYLGDREQYVVVDGASSELTPVISELPPGSLLGPLTTVPCLRKLCTFSGTKQWIKDNNVC